MNGKQASALKYPARHDVPAVPIAGVDRRNADPVFVGRAVMYHLSVADVDADVADAGGAADAERDEVAFLRVGSANVDAFILLDSRAPRNRDAFQPEYVFREGRAVHNGKRAVDVKN